MVENELSGTFHLNGNQHLLLGSEAQQQVNMTSPAQLAALVHAKARKPPEWHTFPPAVTPPQTLVWNCRARRRHTPPHGHKPAACPGAPSGKRHAKTEQERGGEPADAAAEDRGTRTTSRWTDLFESRAVRWMLG